MITTDTLQTAYLSGGCFWGMEEFVRQIPGVLETEVGYTGGGTPTATYEQVKTGRTGHAESLKVVFDPKQLTYSHLLFEFFRMHNPTTRNRQPARQRHRHSIPFGDFLCQ
ncbi:MAG TPA: peptide-methionine (S)-S-oxide reductase [Gallionella sp.]|nr:peptide-methionine (S)-S-oxide reductase [Gallionella sp.]